MELETLFTESKWRILTELSHSSLSPTELAIKTGTSLPNISTQLKLLEALDFIEKQKLDNVEKGKPRKLYSLKKEFAYIILGTKSAIGKKLFNLNGESKYIFSSLLLDERDATYLLIKIYMEHEELFTNCVSIGFIGIDKDRLNLFIVHENPDDCSILKHKKLKRGEREYTLDAHTHRKEDVIAGLERKDQYFVSVLKKIIILADKNSFLSRLKKGEK